MLFIEKLKVVRAAVLHTTLGKLVYKFAYIDGLMTGVVLAIIVWSVSNG